MKKIGFIGGFEKTYLIIYIGKILTELNNRVLVIDTTIMQRARYIVPKIIPTSNYVSEFEGIDIAGGFNKIEEANNYIGDIENSYDIVLIDIDSTEEFYNFKMLDSEKLYFVSSFDDFSLKYGLEIIGNIETELKMEKILFVNNFSNDYNEYLDFLTNSYSTIWEKQQIIFPFDQGDYNEIIENQRVQRIKYRNLSEQFKTSLCNLAQEIVPEIKTVEIKKIMKIM